MPAGAAASARAALPPGAAGSASSGSSSTSSSPSSRTGTHQGNTPSSTLSDCKTGQDASTREDCRIVAVVNSVQKFWTGVFQRSNRTYQPANTVFFTDQIDTGCGTATSAVGPFYCPEDKLVYI